MVSLQKKVSFFFFVSLFSFVLLNAQEAFELQPAQKYEMELAKLKAEKKYLNKLLRTDDDQEKKFDEESEVKKSYTKKRVKKALPTLFVRIDISQQVMQINRNNKTLHTFVALTGRENHPTPTGIFTPQFIRQDYRSEACNRSHMDYAVFLSEDLAVYGTASIFNPNLKMRHNCIRLRPQDSKILFNLVKEYGKYRVKIRITY